MPALAVCVALAAAGCGGGGDDGNGDAAKGGGTVAAGAGNEAAREPAAGSAKVDIASFKFRPDPVRLKAGGTITWTNRDEAAHTAQTEAEASPGFDTDRLELGDAKAVKFDRPGRYRYFCVYHRFMEGTVEVVE